MAASWKLLLVPTLLGTVVLAAPQFDFAAPEVPSGLYEIPEPVPPPVPSGLYETPVAASNTFPVPVLPPELIETPEASNTNSLVVAPQQLFPNVVAPPVSEKDPSMMGMPYDFTWGVQDQDSGNAFSHVETSDGQRTEGEYRVLLPDGRTQVVRFFDNGQGFNAQVTFE